MMSKAPSKIPIDMSKISPLVPMLIKNNKSAQWRCGYTKEGIIWKYSEFDPDHELAWHGGEQPYPEGIYLKVTRRGGGKERMLSEEISWKHFGAESDIISAEFIAPADDRCYPHEMKDV